MQFFFAYLKWNGQVLLKNFFFIVFGHFLQTILLYDGILPKKLIFSSFANFLQILKVEHKAYPMMYRLSYLDIMGFRRGWGVNLTPPQRILVFKYPSRNRVIQLTLCNSQELLTFIPQTAAQTGKNI